MAGWPANEKALEILTENLQKLGITPRREKFHMPGWFRENDEVKIIEPLERRLQAVALGYVDSKPSFQAAVEYVQYGREEEYQGKDVQGKIVLVTSEQPPGQEAPLRSEVIHIAAQKGAETVLFINTKAGGLTLAGTGNFQGDPTPIPAFSLSREEGEWLQRLLEKETPVRLEIATRSYCREVETANVVVRLPGESDQKIVVGAHLDSWDLGQGSIDNGLGSAILFDVVRLFLQFSFKNFYTIEFVWFNGEELGLWGAKKYLEMHSADKFLAMINMDMTGSPTGFNAMGSDELIPLLEGLVSDLPGFHLYRGGDQPSLDQQRSATVYTSGYSHPDASGPSGSGDGSILPQPGGYF
ncbi:MAG: hypothetical protein Kow0042_04310 [Calditrichia bacterium]